MIRSRVPWVTCLLAVCLGAAPTRAADEPVLVFAAASLATAFDAMRPDVERAAGTTVRFSYASSATLARQIEAGAPADLFVSADTDWMNYLVERRLVRSGEGAVSAIAFNRLVLVAPASSTIALKIARNFPLHAALGSGRLAVADPTSVPAGKYAKAGLEYFDVWAGVQDRLAPGENVRVALQFVARGECPLGIVYESDAVADRGVRIVDTFPDGSHPLIQYPAALVSSRANPAATRVLAWMQTASARRVLARNGFRVDGLRTP